MENEFTLQQIALKKKIEKQISEVRTAPNKQDIIFIRGELYALYYGIDKDEDYFKFLESLDDLE